MHYDLEEVRKLAPEGATHYITETSCGAKHPKPIYLKKRRWNKWCIWFESCGWIGATISGHDIRKID